MFKHLFLIALSSLWLTTSVFASSLTAQVDRTHIQPDETLTLTLTYDGRSSEEPDTQDLEQQFDILQRNQASSYNIINGRASSSTQFHFLLAPKSNGQLLIPPIRVENSQSQAITITVNNTPQTNRPKSVFIETQADKTTAYVQEQIILTYKFYYSIELANLEPRLFQLDNLRTTNLPRKDYTSQINGTEYNVMEFKIALTADKSGDYTLPEMRWTVYPQDYGVMGIGRQRGNQMRVSTQALTLHIQPKPASFPPQATWLPAQQLRLTENFNQDLTQLKVGEPFTRSFNITAKGVTAEQLPSLTGFSQHQLLRLYADKPTLDTQTSDDGLSASRSESITLIPNEAGTLTLPAIRLYWWDTQSQSLQTAELPEHTLTVAPAAAATAVPPPPSDTPALSAPAQDCPPPPLEAPKTSPWFYISLGLGTSNLVFIGLWLSQRPRTPKAPKPLKPAEHFQHFTTACQQQNPEQARSHLLLWGSSLSGKAFTNLTALALWLNAPEIPPLLQQLDQHLYSPNGSPWQAQPLLNALQQWQNTHKSKQKQKDTDLAQLY